MASILCTASSPPISLRLTPSWLLLHVSVCVRGYSAGPAPPLFPGQLLPRRRPVSVLVPAVCVCAPSVSAKQPVLSAVRGRLVVVLSMCLIKLLNLTFSLYPM